MARVDFHVHTPKSDDFIGEASVMDVVRAAKSAGVDILVLTDHNSIDGYLDIADRLDEVTPMLVLPGVEVTCRGGAEGIHLLGVMDPARLGKRPRWLLKALGLVPAERNTEGLSDLDVIAVSAAIRKRGGFVVAAHAGSSKGVLKGMRGRQLERVLQQCDFDAIELGTESQRRAGATRLAQLGVLDSSAVVSGSDSHRASSAPGSRRPEGPGDRAVDLPIDPPWSYSKLLAAVRDTKGKLTLDLGRTAIDRFREGSDPGVVAVWRAHDRASVVRAVASIATLGQGTLLLGIRRGGQGGRGLVLARNAPPEAAVERWIWEDVRPTPAVEVHRRTVGDRSYLEVKVMPDLNPFTYGVDGVPLVRRSARVRRARLESPDHAGILQALRKAVPEQLVDRLSNGRPDALTEEELIALFPWRGFLTDEEHASAVRMVAYRVSKGSDAGVLRSWAYLAGSAFREQAIDVVRSIARSFSLSEAKRGIREQLEQIGGSRALRRRVTSAFEGALTPANPLGLADESYDSDALRRTCQRLSECVGDEHLEGVLRDVAIDETKRTTDLIATLVTDDQVRVVVEAVADEMGGEAGEQVQAALIASRAPVSVIAASRPEDVAGTVVLVASDQSEVVASGSHLIAVHAPVRNLPDLLETHRQIYAFDKGHVVPRDALLDMIEARGELNLDPTTQVLVFRSCVRAGLPRWWSVAGDLALTDLAEALTQLIGVTRDGAVLGSLLRCLALLPGDFSPVADEAGTRSRAQVVQELRGVHHEPWKRRVATLLPPRRDIEAMHGDAVTYGGATVHIAGEPIVDLLKKGTLEVEEVDRRSAEACARQLKHVASEALFDLLLKGAREGWHTVTTLRACDEATYVLASIRGVIQD